MPSRCRGAMPSFLVAVLAAGCLLAAAGSVGGGRSGALPTEPRLQLRGDLQLPAGSGVGVARVRNGWIVAGTDALVRIDDALAPIRTVAPAIPPHWRAQGYTQLGDIDVAGGRVYAPFVQADDSVDRQVIARFDATTLRFVDAVEVGQHDLAFVAIDAREQVAYSMDRVDGTELLRYDIADRWRRLPALGLGRTLEGVRGADVASGSVWLSTDDDRHGVYRVDRRSGVVHDLGSAGHFEGTVGGVDATPRGRARVHVVVTEGDRAVLTGFGVVGDASERVGDGTSGWPPVLVMGAVVLVVAAGGASAVLVYRARVGLRPRPRRT
ncbi:MAG: hypothetical protein ACXW2C_04285 [Acidimicrobiia bacterium]